MQSNLLDACGVSRDSLSRLHGVSPLPSTQNGTATVEADGPNVRIESEKLPEADSNQAIHDARIVDSETPQVVG